MINTDRSKYDKKKPFNVAQRIQVDDGQIFTPGEEYNGEYLDKLPDLVFEQSLVIQQDDPDPVQVDKVTTTSTPPKLPETKPNP